MSYQQDVFHLISSIIGQNNNVVIPVEMIKFTGDYHTAALLSQLIYWQGKQKDPNGWIYKTYDQWEAEIVLSKYQTSRAAKALVKLGILETKVARVRLDNGMLGDKAVHYRLNQDEFAEKFTEHLSIMESKETSLSKVKELHFPKSSNLTNLSINTENTNKDYDDVQPPDPKPTQEQEKNSSSSFSENDFIKTIASLMALVPEQYSKPTVEKTVEKGLKAHTEDYIRLAILYTISHSNGGTWQKFKAFLGKCIDNGWADGWAPEFDQVDNEQRKLKFLKSRRGMPDDILKADAQKGCKVSAQVLMERGVNIS
jgi:hypothetical protein